MATANLQFDNTLQIPISAPSEGRKIDLIAYYRRNHAIARERFKSDPTKCYQRHIRELYAELEPREQLRSLSGACVTEITREQAASIILKYEWLAGDPKNKSPMGRGIQACYGLFSHDGELIGANCLGVMGGEIGNICGELYADKTVCLMRGACVHYAPKNAGSFFTAETCKQAYKDPDRGWSVFFAYSDTRNASEVGTIYQACNWFYLGEDLGRAKRSHHTNFISPDGTQKVTSYKLNHDKDRKFLRSLGWNESKGSMRSWLKRPMSEGGAGWTQENEYGKKKWCWFEGSPSEKRRLKNASRYDLDLPRPKRP
jgi:hypothetical protein